MYLEYALLLTLVASTLAFVLMLKKAHNDPRNKVDFWQLMLGDDGRPSKSAVVLFGSFLFTTFCILYLMLTKALDSTYFGLYLTAWVVPTVAATISRSKKTEEDTKDIKTNLEALKDEVKDALSS